VSIQNNIQKANTDRIEHISNSFQKARYVNNEQNRKLGRVSQIYGKVTEQVEEYEINYNDEGEFVSAIIDGKTIHNKETAIKLIKQEEKGEVKKVFLNNYLPKIKKRISQMDFGKDMVKNYGRIYKIISEAGFNIQDYPNQKKVLDTLIRVQAVR